MGKKFIVRNAEEKKVNHLEDFKKEKKKYEFSKIAFWYASCMNTIVILFSIFMIFRTNDLSPLNVLIPSVGTEMATAFGFYYTKAKVENRLKILLANGIKPEREDVREF